MPKNEARLNRVNEELKKEISRVLTFELKNSKVTGLVSVTKAKITPDFKYWQNNGRTKRIFRFHS